MIQPPQIPLRDLARFFLRTFGCLIAASMLHACGGAEVTGGGIGGSGYVAGPIEELGSIVVQGIRFDIDDATVVVNGDAAESGELALGMYVGVYATFDEDGNTGTASRVEFEESVSGPIQFVSANRQRLVVLDQTVLLDDSTRLSDITIDALRPGVVVTVSGSRDADNAVVATLVARRAPAQGCRVLGDVSDLDGSSFRLGDLDVDASGALIVGGALADGDSVGVLADDCDGDGPLLAREVRRLDATRPPPPGPFRSVQGVVVNVVAEEQAFRMHVPALGPVRVELMTQTTFEGGTAADISRNDRLRVSGRVNDRGVLRAARVVFLEESVLPPGVR
jgi:hypothetical protein